MRQRKEFLSKATAVCTSVSTKNKRALFGFLADAKVWPPLPSWVFTAVPRYMWCHSHGRHMRSLFTLDLSKNAHKLGASLSFCGLTKVSPRKVLCFHVCQDMLGFLQYVLGCLLTWRYNNNNWYAWRWRKAYLQFTLCLSQSIEIFCFLVASRNEN